MDVGIIRIQKTWRACCTLPSLLEFYRYYLTIQRGLELTGCLHTSIQALHLED